MTAVEGARRAGLRTVGSGLVAILLGGGALWLSVAIAGGAKTILGAGPLIGGGMVGHGLVQAVLGGRLRFLRWIVAVVGAVVAVGGVLLLLELTLGVTLE